MVARLCALQTEFGGKGLISQHGVIGFECFQRRHRHVLVFNQGQQGLAQTKQIPISDLRLSGKGITPLVVRMVADMRRVKTIQKLKRPVVNGQAQQTHVVGVHHTVAKAD